PTESQNRRLTYRPTVSPLTASLVRAFGRRLIFHTRQQSLDFLCLGRVKSVDSKSGSLCMTESLFKHRCFGWFLVTFWLKHLEVFEGDQWTVRTPANNMRSCAD